MTHIEAISALVEQYVTGQVAAVQTVADEFQTQLTDADAQVVALQAQGGMDAATIASLRKQLADCQAPPPPAPAPNVVEFRDFAAQYTSGVYQYAGVLKGRGTDLTTYRMTPRTSTKAGAVPSQGSGQPTQIRLMRVGGLDGGHAPTDIDVSGFTLQGTDQGHIYHGLTVGYSKGAKIHDLRITGVRGNAASPPGETFSLELWHANGARVSNVVIDGKDATTGAGVAATLLGLNSCNDVVIDNYTGNNAVSGMGIAIWDSYNVTVTNADLRNCRHPINIERCHPGVMRFVNPDLRGQTDKGPAITCNTDNGSTQLIIEEPRWDAATYGPLRIGVSSNPFMGNPQLQKIEDVHVIIGGVDVSKDKTKVLIGQVW